jgi:hypothetical protein
MEYWGSKADDGLILFSGPEDHVFNVGIDPIARFKQMKARILMALIALAVFLTGLMLGACANTQIDTELPADHPAAPTAEAAAFVPPPNPFAMDTADETPIQQPDISDSGHHPRPADHPKDQEDGGHGHMMQPMQPQSTAPADDRQEKNTEHQH